MPAPICTTETQRQAETTGGSAQNQRPHCRRLHQQQPPCQHPIRCGTTSSREKLFCKLDCSQAYYCHQMADQRSVELLVFKFLSRTFAYRRLAQGLSRALSAFSSFMREYLDSVIKADQCAQYVDDIGIAAKTTEQLIKNIKAVFICIRKAGLKLTIEKCHFGVTQIEFLFLFPKSKKQVQKKSALSITTAITYPDCQKNSLACMNF